MNGFIELTSTEGNIEFLYAWDCRFTWKPFARVIDGKTGVTLVTPKIGMSFETYSTIAEILKKGKESDK